MTLEAIAQWSGFFSIVAQVGATLAGLLFVGLTISLDHVLSAHGYLARGFTALALQFEILVIGVLGAVPGQPPYALGLELIVTGVVLSTGIVLFIRFFPENEQSTVLGNRAMRTLRGTLLSISTIFPMIAGLSLIVGWGGALYWLVPVVIASVYLSIGYSWVFAIEIPRRKRLADQSRE